MILSRLASLTCHRATPVLSRLSTSPSASVSTLLVRSHRTMLASTVKTNLRQTVRNWLFGRSLSSTGGGGVDGSKQRLIGWWLLSCSGLTFATVAIGGVTRLTESGLSMVTWHPFKELPPRDNKSWEAEFARYQEFPEFKVKNSELTLEQFKWIWWMEYAHRTLGRTIGALYFLPAALFWAKGWFDRGLKIRAGVFGGILAFQGLLGWYMVKSGLEHREVYTHEPRVSQYRLAAHLGTAMVFYSLIFWNALTNLAPPEVLRAPNPQVVTAPNNLAGLMRLRKLVMNAKLLVFLTALSGAFVAGLDAGLVYNSWPKMADRWIPTDIAAQKPLWRNMFENATTVQFNHRHLGEATGLFILGLWAYSLKLKLPPRARMASNLLALAVVTQVSLGIANLLYYVPTQLASAHQVNAMVTLSMVLWLSKELIWVKRFVK